MVEVATTISTPKIVTVSGQRQIMPVNCVAGVVLIVERVVNAT